MELIPLGAFIRFVHFVPEHEVQFKTTETEEELFFSGFAVSDWEMFCCHRDVKFCEWTRPNETLIVVLPVIFKGLDFPSRLISFW